jgi:hypothetical protein
MAFVGVGGRHGVAGIWLGGGLGIGLGKFLLASGSCRELLRVNPIRESHYKKSIDNTVIQCSTM